MSDSKEVVIYSKTKQSKITRFKLEEDVVNLKMAGLSCREIAEELRNSGKIPEGEVVDQFVIARFLEKVPHMRRKLVSENKKRLLNVVNTNFDIYHEINSMYRKTKLLLENIEDKAASENKNVDPYRFKALMGEMREFLKQMTDIQKELSDYNNIRMFVGVVVSVLKEECPEKLPVLADKLRLSKGTQWFAEILQSKEEC